MAYARKDYIYYRAYALTHKLFHSFALNNFHIQYVFKSYENFNAF